MTARLILRAADLVAERPEGTSDDIHFTEALAASVIGYASRPGELVLDPFVGYGTTVAVAERMGRRAIGIELIVENLEIARRRSGGAARLILGDARELSRLVDEPVVRGQREELREVVGQDEVVEKGGGIAPGEVGER